MVPLKYLGNFWRTLEMPLVNCEIIFQLTCFKKSILVSGTAANQVLKFRITNTKLYVPVVTLSTQDRMKLLEQLESGFKRTINCNKLKIALKNKSISKQIFRSFIDSCFQGVNVLFVLSFKDDDGQKIAINFIFQL